MSRKPSGEDEEARKARQRAEVTRYEKDHDLVTGTAYHRGDGPGGGPAGGQEWEGRARSAIARQAAGKRLNHLDADALARYPNPGGWVGSEP